VDIYQKNKDQIQLVVIDLVMPKTGGLDCFRELKKIDPQVKALLTTGYEMDSVAQIAFDEGMLGLLPKPFQIHRLSEAIAMALAAKVPRMH
jgi:CheY-like chemotaxis protein